MATARVEGEELIIPVDLIVPEGAASGGGRRGARLGPHGNRAARRAVGLEAALVDHSTMTVAALDPSDTRSFEVEVAGAAALLVAKAHKIHDRLASSRPGRIDDKDAADIYRLMQTTSPSDIASRFVELRGHEIAGPATEAAITYLGSTDRDGWVTGGAPRQCRWSCGRDGSVIGGSARGFRALPRRRLGASARRWSRPSGRWASLCCL